jgi:hypothetical protein
MRAWALLLVASTAFADDVPRIDVEVGATVEKNVQYARGYMCDDPSLVTAEMVTRDDHNVWIVKGVKVGETMCRVGLDKLRVWYVFDVRVMPARQKR